MSAISPEAWVVLALAIVDGGVSWRLARALVDGNEIAGVGYYDVGIKLSASYSLAVWLGLIGLSNLYGAGRVLRPGGIAVLRSGVIVIGLLATVAAAVVVNYVPFVVAVVWVVAAGIVIAGVVLSAISSVRAWRVSGIEVG